MRYLFIIILLSFILSCVLDFLITINRGSIYKEKCKILDNDIYEFEITKTNKIDNDIFKLEVRSLAISSDYLQNEDLLKNVRSHHREYVLYLLRRGFSVKASIQGSREVFQLLTHTSCTLEDLDKVLATSQKLFMIRGSF